MGKIAGRTESTLTVKNCDFEYVCLVWIIIVAIQYLGRYFFGLSIDFLPAYFALLILMIAVIGLRSFHAIRLSLGLQEESPAQENSGTHARKSHRPRR